MSKSVWLHANVPNECVKVFASYDSTIEWLRQTIQKIWRWNVRSGPIASVLRGRPVALAAPSLVVGPLCARCAK
jgi:hypothetical protein